MKENSTQAERLSLLMHHFRLNQTTLSHETGIKQANLSPVVQGKKELSRGMTNAILKRYEKLSANWLLKGVGPMFIEEDMAENELKEPGIPYETPDEKNADPLHGLRRVLEDFERRISKLEANQKPAKKKD